MNPPAQAAPRPPRGIRLVAVDVDGTLLRSDKQMTRSVGEAIRAATAAGVRVVLASARPPRSLRTIYDALQLDTLQINYNGALIFDRSRNRPLRHVPLDVALARKVIAAGRRVDRRCCVSLEILDRWYTDHYDQTLPTETSISFRPDFVGPLNAFLTVPVTKLMLLAPPDRMERITAAIQRRFAGQVGMTVADRHLLQVMHHTVNKGEALAEIASRYGVDRSEVMAIGDAPNDVEMMRWAGLGVAVANAWDAALDAADAVVPSNDEDGVAHAIDRYILADRSQAVP